MASLPVRQARSFYLDDHHPRDYRELATSLAKNKTVTKLSIRTYYNNLFHPVFKALSSVTTLTTLTIAAEIRPEFRAPWLAAYRANPGLTAVILRFLLGGDSEFLMELFPALADCPSLSYLSLAEINFFDLPSMDRLSDLLQSSSTLSELYLGYCELNEKLVACLARGLKGNPNLKLLSIGGEPLDINGSELTAKELAPLLEAATHLLYLHIGLSKLDHENGVLLGNFLSANPPLLGLQIFPGKTVEGALLSLVNALTVNTTLQGLALPGGQDVGWLDRLSEILYSGLNVTLTHLRLTYSGSAEGAIPRFCRAIASNQHFLRSLSFETSKLTEVKVQDLVAMIDANTTLEELSLHNCVDDDGFPEMKTAINRNSLIRNLKITGFRPSMTIKILDYLPELIRTNTSLNHIALDHGSTMCETQSYILQLGAALAQNTILTSLDISVKLQQNDARSLLRQSTSLKSIVCDSETPPFGLLAKRKFRRPPMPLGRKRDRTEDTDANVRRMVQFSSSSSSSVEVPLLPLPSPQMTHRVFDNPFSTSLPIPKSPTDI